VQACPEGAIDFSYQIDLAKCKSHRACVKACGAIGAIDFSRAAASETETFDLVLDLSREPLIRTHELPQGYAAPGDDPLEQALAAQKLVGLVGEFEKPRFFAYNARICAHSRSGREGCNLCLDVCSSGAIRADGDHVKVEAHLCAGCGGCATVCPSGAMTYAYPKVPDTGRRLKAALAAYREAGGKDACIVFHDAREGRNALLELGRRGKGLPARAIPVECFHVASVGIDLMLGAIAYGASQVVVLNTEKVAGSYAEATRRQMGYAQTIVNALGYAGTHFAVLDSPAALWELEPAATVAKAATFNLSPEKRTTLDFALEHLARGESKTIPLPAGAPFGALAVNKQTCTLCKACIGACPESALIDAQDTPSLRFIERNCVQCGLCADTCPEDAITLLPRLMIGGEAKTAVTLNEAEPFHCVRCAKPFGTRQMVESMLGKVGGHSMFAGGTRRLQMCADCRVVDMMENKGEASIFEFKK
jgi:ferredoxin